MQQFTGIVISTKLAKTATVKVDSRWTHPVYKKTITRSKKYLVQDDLGIKDGDQVVIQATRPISKKKCFKIIKVIK